MQRRISVIDQAKVPNRPIFVGDFSADAGESVASTQVGFGPIHSPVCLVRSGFIMSGKPWCPQSRLVYLFGWQDHGQLQSS